MIDLQNLQIKIGRWHRLRFPEAQLYNVGLKLCEEAGEVAKAINRLDGRNSATGGGTVPEETADVLICLLVILDRWFPGEDLLANVEIKLNHLLDPNSTHPARLTS